MTPKFLYHATPSTFYKEIVKSGKIKCEPPCNLWDSSNNYVYLSVDPWNAESYAEVGVNVYSENHGDINFYDDDIIILEVNAFDLDKNLLDPDENNKSNYDGTFNDVITYQYNGDIPLEYCHIFKG